MNTKLITFFCSLIFIKFASLVSGGGLENDLVGFGLDRSLYMLRATETSSFARYQPSISLRDLQLNNDQFSENDEPSSTMPLVVVAIPTFNRPQFLLKSLDYVARQQYPRDRIEVAILDDSPESLEDAEEFLNKVEMLNNYGTKVHYKHRKIMPEIGQENIGQKRNSIVRWIKYDLISNETDFIIIHWDDDDWQAPHRIMKQVLPLMTGQSHMSALDLHTIMVLHENQIYSRWAPDGKKSPMPIMSVNGGTLCYWASVWNDDTQFPNLGCGEDIMFVDRMIHSRDGNEHRSITILDDSDISVIYMRHEGNTWSGLDPSSWLLIPNESLPPRFKKDSLFYKQIQYWKKPNWNGFWQKNQEHWVCSSHIDRVKTLVVNEIRGLSQ